MKNSFKKISVLGFVMLSLTITAHAQWTRNSATLQTYLTNTGDNVGIGTTNPQFKLDVQSNSAASMSFKSTTGNSNIIIDRANSASTSGVNYRTNGVPFWQTGTIGTDNYVIRNINLGTTSLAVNYLTNNVGIGTTTPSSKLHIVRGSSGATPMTNAGIVLEGSSQTFLNLLVPTGFETGVGFGNPTNSADAGIYYNGVGTGKLDLRTGGNVSRITIDGTGNVGIGITAPAYKLDVCGTMRAKEVRVETGWCDYVFAEDYKLKSIDEVAAFINDHKHLPGIVPASEVEKEGMKVGEMSKAMMEKIEELMLYVIDQNNQIKEMKKQNELQQQQIDNLKK